MQKGETICEATVREVLEETGLQIECTTLLTVECAGGNWLRFVLTGLVVGGNLKTPAQADQESLQAKWIANLEELTLRSMDITHLIDRARYVSDVTLCVCACVHFEVIISWLVVVFHMAFTFHSQ